MACLKERDALVTIRNMIKTTLDEAASKASSVSTGGGPTVHPKNNVNVKGEAAINMEVKGKDAKSERCQDVSMVLNVIGNNWLTNNDTLSTEITPAFAKLFYTFASIESMDVALKKIKATCHSSRGAGEINEHIKTLIPIDYKSFQDSKQRSCMFTCQIQFNGMHVSYPWEGPMEMGIRIYNDERVDVVLILFNKENDNMMVDFTFPVAINSETRLATITETGCKQVILDESDGWDYDRSTKVRTPKIPMTEYTDYEKIVENLAVINKDILSKVQRYLRELSGPIIDLQHVARTRTNHHILLSIQQEFDVKGGSKGAKIQKTSIPITIRKKHGIPTNMPVQDVPLFLTRKYTRDELLHFAKNKSGTKHQLACKLVNLAHS